MGGDRSVGGRPLQRLVQFVKRGIVRDVPMRLRSANSIAARGSACTVNGPPAAGEFSKPVENCSPMVTGLSSRNANLQISGVPGCRQRVAFVLGDHDLN